MKREEEKTKQRSTRQDTGGGEDKMIKTREYGREREGAEVFFSLDQWESEVCLLA